MTEEKPQLAAPKKRAPNTLVEFDLKLRPMDLLRWLLAVGLGLWGAWILHQQSTPFPTEPPSIFALILLALGFAAFFFSPETSPED